MMPFRGAEVTLAFEALNSSMFQGWRNSPIKAHVTPYPPCRLLHLEFGCNEAVSVVLTAPYHVQEVLETAGLTRIKVSER